MWPAIFGAAFLVLAYGALIGLAFGPLLKRWRNSNRTAGATMPYPLILNGDHAEFEREHADTKPEDRPDWPLPSMDAQDWAKAFCKIHPGLDEGDMIGWFANALMRGYDEGRRCNG